VVVVAGEPKVGVEIARELGSAAPGVVIVAGAHGSICIHQLAYRAEMVLRVVVRSCVGAGYELDALVEVTLGDGGAPFSALLADFRATPDHPFPVRRAARNLPYFNSPIKTVVEKFRPLREQGPSLMLMANPVPKLGVFPFRLPLLFQSLWAEQGS